MGDHRNSADSGAWHSRLCIVLLALGIALIVASWTPIGHVASHTMWNRDDSAIYSKLRQEFHRTTTQSPARTGLTESEMKTRQERLETLADAMRKKLEHARQQPQRWSRYLLWSGILLTTVGGLGHLATRK